MIFHYCYDCIRAIFELYITCVNIAAPAAVTALSLQSDGRHDSLKASWIAATGVLESYHLLLSTSSSPDRQLTLPPTASQWLFSGLTPGEVYQVSVKTRSGDLTAENSTTGRTGKTAAPPAYPESCQEL